MIDNFKFELGDRIKQIRLQNKLTQTEFGEEFGKYGKNDAEIKSLKVNKSTISRWEKNQITPDKQHLEIIAKMGGVSLRYLQMGEVS